MGRLRVLAEAVPRVSCERIPGILKYKTNNVLCKNFPCQFMLIFIAQFVLLFLSCQKKNNLPLLISLPLPAHSGQTFLLPVNQAKEPEHCSQHSSLSSLTEPPLEIVWVLGQCLPAQNDTRMEVDFCHNVSSVCKLHLMTVQCPAGQRYPSRPFCLCTAKKEIIIKRQTNKSRKG